MIKNKFYIILFSFSIVLSQTSTLSFYGQGEYLNSYNASSIALGNSKYFGENAYQHVRNSFKDEFFYSLHNQVFK